MTLSRWISPCDTRNALESGAPLHFYELECEQRGCQTGGRGLFFMFGEVCAHRVLRAHSRQANQANRMAVPR